MRFSRTWATVALALPFSVLAIPAAEATVHTDPCPGQHVQVWSEVGNSGAGQATNHFVCGQVGQDGKDGKDGAPGEQGPAGPTGPQGETGPAGADGQSVQGPAGPAGETGAPGAEGPAGVAGADGVPGPAGADGATGPAGPAGLNGQNVSEAGVDGPQGPAGPAGVDGKDGVTKTIYITRQADGTDEVVDGLPKTGASDTQIIFFGLGAALIAAGVVTVYAIRKK